VCADVGTLSVVNMSHKSLVPLDAGMRRTIDYFKAKWL